LRVVMLICLVTSCRSCRTIRLVANYVRQQVSGSCSFGESMRRFCDNYDGRPNATPRLVNKGLSLIRQGMTFEHAAEQSRVSVLTLLRARSKGNSA
jgi:putative DNA-invertase from lambdoid prophage Rac